MIVSRLELKNWRNFRAVDVPLSDRVFIVGPNASGKSNLLDALRFLRDIAKPGGGLQRAISQRGGLSKIRCLAARREPEVEIAVELSEGGEVKWRYEIGIGQQQRGYRQPVLTYERVFQAGKSIVLRPDQFDAKDEERKTQTHLEQIGSNQHFREIARFFESIRYLHLVPQFLRTADSLQSSSAGDDPFGRSFLETVVKTPEKTRRRRLAQIERALKEAVPQLKDLKVEKDETGIPHLEATYTHWRPNAGRQREDQFSDGTIRLIGLFWSLLDGEAPLLLEEPELSLHNAIVSKLPSLFYRLRKTKKTKRQIFVSTHSFDILSEKSIGGEEVVLLQPDAEGTIATVASSIKEVRNLLDAGFSVGDAALPHTKPSGLRQLDLFG
ncbi:MAG: AAA family ATPase [Acidobacteria bacterium]|nr:AAA family ATPase [Acidobacteriota bacterium]